MARCASCPVLLGTDCFNDTKGLSGRCTAVCVGDPAETWLAGCNSEGAGYICRTAADLAASYGVDCSGNPPVMMSGPPVFRKTDEYRRLLDRRAACPHLGPVCQAGCAGDVHECKAGVSNWPGQPHKAGLAQCQACPVLPVLD